MKDDELVCCVCLHRLSDHVDEGGVWRCHSLGYDTYQCECALRKDRVDGDITEYDLATRCRSTVADLSK